MTYSDVGGCKDSIEKLREVVELPLLHPERFARLSGPRRVRIGEHGQRRAVRLAAHSGPAVAADAGELLVCESAANSRATMSGVQGPLTRTIARSEEPGGEATATMVSAGSGRIPERSFVSG